VGLGLRIERHSIVEEQWLARASHDVKYSSKIIKAGALLPDTKLLLRGWDEGLDVQSNLDKVRQDNLFGKACSRVEDILGVFKHRYLKDLELLAAPARTSRFPLSYPTEPAEPGTPTEVSSIERMHST
jgi:hypothetical protein